MCVRMTFLGMNISRVCLCGVVTRFETAVVEARTLIREAVQTHTSKHQTSLLHQLWYMSKQQMPSGIISRSGKCFI